MFDYIGWDAVKDRIERGLESAIRDKVVTYDLARQMEGATEVKCSEFADAIIERL
jgi:isocitrate dehydrogenase